MLLDSNQISPVPIVVICWQKCTAWL